MHTALSFLPALVILAAGYALDRWVVRPSARARWAALSLRGKIARTIRLRYTNAALQAGQLALYTALELAGILPPGSWLILTAVTGVSLAANLYLLRCALLARRAYDSLGPMAYLAEIQHAFGTVWRDRTRAPASTD